MAKTVIAGNAAIITSALKLEDLRTIQKYRPKALTLLGGEDGKEPIFAIGVTEGAGSINKIGASFGREANDGSGLATITMAIGDEFTGDVREWVADHFGEAIINLNALEGTLSSVLEEIATERDAMIASISVIA